jgi:hypothetical protein
MIDSALSRTGAGAPWSNIHSKLVRRSARASVNRGGEKCPLLRADSVTSRATGQERTGALRAKQAAEELCLLKGLGLGVCMRAGLCIRGVNNYVRSSVRVEDVRVLREAIVAASRDNKPGFV